MKEVFWKRRIWQDYKYLVMAQGYSLYKELGRLSAQEEITPFFVRLSEILTQPRKEEVNAYSHVYGYVKGYLKGEEKAALLFSIEKKDARVPNMLYSWIVRLEVEYLFTCRLLILDTSPLGTLVWHKNRLLFANWTQNAGICVTDLSSNWESLLHSREESFRFLLQVRVNQEGLKNPLLKSRKT